jgi:hypothetical protein
MFKRSKCEVGMLLEKQGHVTIYQRRIPTDHSLFDSAESNERGFILTLLLTLL